MKNIVLSLVLAVFVLLGTTAVFAANGDIVDALQTSIYFTSNNKDAYTSKTDLVSAVGQLSLKNKLNSAVTVKYGNTELVLDAENKINITQITPLTLTALQSKNLTLKVVSDDNVEAGEYSGTLQIVNSSNPTQILDEVPVRVLVPALEATSIEVKDKESDLTDTKLEKGQKFTVTVNYKNIADQSDIENVNVRVGVYDGADNKLQDLLVDIDENDLETDEDQSDLTNGKSDSVTFEFEMPYAIDDKDTYTVFAEVIGDGEDTSASFYARDTKEITASVADDKVAVTKATVVPTSLACGVKRAKFSIELTNIGDNQEDVQLFVRNTATGFEKLLNGGDDVELGDDFEDESDFIIPVEEYVDLTDIKSGQNTYTVVAYFNDGDANTQRDVTVTSQACDGSTTTTTTPTTTTPTTNNDVVVVTPTTQPTTTPVVPTVPTSTTPYVSLKDVSGYSFDNDWLVPAVIGVGGLIVGILVAVLLVPRP